MKSIKRYDVILTIACTLLVSITVKGQGSNDDLRNYFASNILVGAVYEDTAYISSVNNSRKLSQEDKETKIVEHREEIARYNENIKQAVDYWTGEQTLITIDSTNADYIDYNSRILKVKEEEIKGINAYIISYVSTPLFYNFKDRMFSLSHRPAMALVERDLDEETGKIINMVLMSQGVPSAGLLGCYLNVLNAQTTDMEKGITWKDKEVFKERMKELKQKPLLIPKEFISDKLTEELIREMYPYAFEILDEKQMDEKLQGEERDDYVIYQIIPQVATTAGGTSLLGTAPVEFSKTSIMYKSAIFDVSSGRRMDIQEIKLSLAGSDGTSELTKKELKNILDQIGQ